LENVDIKDSIKQSFAYVTLAIPYVLMPF